MVDSQQGVEYPQDRVSGQPLDLSSFELSQGA